jgi:hypothetical protein
MHTYIPKCTHAYIHQHTYMHSLSVWMHTRGPSGRLQSCMHTCIHTYMHTYTHECMHTSTYMHAFSQCADPNQTASWNLEADCYRAYIHTYIHTSTHECTYSLSLWSKTRERGTWGAVVISFCFDNKIVELPCTCPRELPVCVYIYIHIHTCS